MMLSPTQLFLLGWRKCQEAMLHDARLDETRHLAVPSTEQIVEIIRRVSATPKDELKEWPIG